MIFIAFTALRFGLFVFYSLVASPVLGAAYLLSHFLDSHESLHGPRWIVGVPGMAWLFGSGWMVHDTASRVLLEKHSLYKSIDLSFYAARFHRSFLPLVGRGLTPADRHKDNEKDEN